MAAATPDNAIIRDLTPSITILSLPFLRFGVLRLGMRTTIVKLPSGALAVFSPIPLTPSVSAKLTSLGNNVAYLIAPDIEHHMYLSQWSAAYPSAKVLGPAGLPEKHNAPSTKGGPTPTPLNFATVFTTNNQTVSPEFDAAFDYAYAAAHPSKELVFLHRADKTVIVADYLFNLPAREAFSQSPKPGGSGLLTRFFGSVMNTRGKATWQKRFLWYALGGEGRASVTESAAKINTWEFENLVVAHGDVIEKNGREVFERVFEWHLKEAGARKSK